MKTLVWESTINGSNYNFVFQFKNQRRYSLAINDNEPIVFIHKEIFFKTEAFTIDEPFTFNDIRMRLVISLGLWGGLKNADIVVDNKFSKTGKEAKILKIINWESTINGSNYKFICQANNRRQYNLIINDSEPIVLTNYNPPLKDPLTFNEPFTFDGISMRLVVSLSLWGGVKDADVIVDNRFSKTGKKYIPLPKWAYPFFILCALPVLGGGAITIIIACCGIAGCAKTAKIDTSTIIKVLICIGITLVEYLALILLTGVVGILLNG